MKTAIYFMKLIGTGAIALCGFIVFLCELISSFGTVAGAFRGLALCGFGAFLLAYVLETCKCPIKLSIKISKTQASTPVEANEATAEIPAIDTIASTGENPAIDVASATAEIPVAEVVENADEDTTVE